MHLRAIALITLLLVVQGWCKPSKDVDEFDEYNDDAQADENDDYSQNEEENPESPDTIEEPPQIVSEPLSKRVIAGTTVTLPCLTENADSFAVVWKKDDRFLYTGSSAMTNEPNRIEITANNSLVIHNAMVNDSSDSYTCSIITGDTPITITHRLVVLDPTNVRSPSIMTTTTMKTTITTTTSQMVPSTSSSTPFIQVVPTKKIDVTQGDNVSFGCNPFPRLQFQQTEMKWYHKNVKLYNNSHTMMHGNYITIFKVGRHDAGIYQCLADNGMDNPPINAIHLTVNYPPEIEKVHSIIHTGTGIESEITCTVHAHPRANVTWYKNQKELPKRENISQKENKSKYSLKIMHTNEQDLGDYTCQAKNRLGQANMTISLAGTPSKAIISGAKLISLNNNNFSLKWQLRSYSPIVQYKLKYRQKGDEEWQEIEPRVKNGIENQYIVEHFMKGLEAGSYEAILQARNSFGWSPPSDTLIFKQEDVPNEKAASVTGSAVSIRQSWAISVSLLVVCAFRNL